MLASGTLILTVTAPRRARDDRKAFAWLQEHMDRLTVCPPSCSSSVSEDQRLVRRTDTITLDAEGRDLVDGGNESVPTTRENLKIGLALSGGGMRAAIFHLGLLRDVSPLTISSDG